MAGSLIGALRVVLGLDSASFDKGVREAKNQIHQTAKTFKNVGSAMTGVGIGISAAITAPFLALASQAIPAALESRDAMAQVTAALASMGNGAGFTAAQLAKLADGAMNQSLYDDDEILRKVTANLLTFGSVAGENFKRAQIAALDLSTRMGGDLQGATLLIGKALQDPIKGVTSLGRAGIQFSVDQKAMIASLVETGRVAEAQAIILGELQKQFGGSAEAARNADPFAKARQSMNNFNEVVGNILIKILPTLTDSLTGLLNAFSTLSPEVQKWSIIIVGAVAVLGPLLIGLGAIFTAIGVILPSIATLSTVVAALSSAWAVLSVGMSSVVVPILGVVFAALLPILAPLAAVAGAVALVYAAWKHWDKIGPILARAWAAVKGAVAGIIALHQAMFIGIKTWIVDKLAVIWNTVKAGIDAVKGYFYGLYDAVVGNSYVPDMVDGIRDQFARLDGVMVSVAQAATGKTAQAFADLAGRTQSLLDSLFPEQAEIAALQSKYEALDAALAAKLISPLVYSAARDRLRVELEKLRAEADAQLLGIEGGLEFVDVTKYQIEDLGETFKVSLGDAAKEQTGRVAESFAEMAQGITDSLGGLVDAIKGGDFFDIIGAVFGALDKIGKATGGFGIGPFEFGGSGSGSSTPAFATGGSFEVGGRSGIDKNLIQFRASKGEMVNIQKGGQKGAAPRSGTTNVFDLRGAVMTHQLMADINAQVAAGEARAIRGGAALAGSNLARSQRGRLA